jgi:hypothetical protein
MKAAALIQPRFCWGTGWWLSGKRGPGIGADGLPGAVCRFSVRGYPAGIVSGIRRGFREDEINRGHFNLRLPLFPALLTLFRHFLTLLFEETNVSASGWRESALSRPGK